MCQTMYFSFFMYCPWAHPPIVLLCIPPARTSPWPRHRLHAPAVSAPPPKGGRAGGGAGQSARPGGVGASKHSTSRRARARAVSGASRRGERGQTGRTARSGRAQTAGGLPPGSVSRRARAREGSGAALPVAMSTKGRTGNGRRSPYPRAPRGNTGRVKNTWPDRWAFVRERGTGWRGCARWRIIKAFFQLHEFQWCISNLEKIAIAYFQITHNY